MSQVVRQGSEVLLPREVLIIFRFPPFLCSTAEGLAWCFSEHTHLRSQAKPPLTLMEDLPWTETSRASPKSSFKHPISTSGHTAALGAHEEINKMEVPLISFMVPFHKVQRVPCMFADCLSQAAVTGEPTTQPGQQVP